MRFIVNTAALWLQVLAVSVLFSHVEAKTCEVGQGKYENNTRMVVLPHDNPCCTKVLMGGVNVLSPIRPFKPVYSPLISENASHVREHYKLNCKGKDETCYTGWTAKNRDRTDSDGWTMVSPDNEITCNGVVKQWRYQAKTSNPFRAVVWRHVPASSTQFKIIGFNEIPTGPINQDVTFNIPEDQRFHVKAGDMIGWSFGDGVLAYNHGGGFSVRWLGGFLHSSLVVDQVHDFNGINQDREYSFSAAIEPAAECVSSPLGMASGKISDSSITASSYQPCGVCFDQEPKYARLGRSEYWMSHSSNQKPWIQVDLRSPYNVTGLQIEGNYDSVFYQYWVKQIKVKFGITENNVKLFEDSSGNAKIFDANTDPRDMVEISLDGTWILSQFVRIYPINCVRADYSSLMCVLRFEILGCLQITED